MPVANNIIFPYLGTHAGIPTGYTRETTLDSKFIKGASSGNNPNSTGGAATHTHTSPTSAHTHTLNTHNHTITLAAGSGSKETGSTAQNAIKFDHVHPTANTSSTANGSLGATTVSYGAVSNNPPYVEVIYIKSQGTHDIPDDGVIIRNDSTTRTGFNVCDGTNGTTDLRNKYLKGAGTGANAGGTGGSTTNIHPLTHTHSVATHTHSSVTIPAVSSPTRYASGAAGNEVANYTHDHSATPDAATDVLDSVSVTCAETVEPGYYKLYTIQNISGGYKVPDRGDIAIYLGTLASIPTGWKIVSSMYDKYLKVANTSGEIGNTGGSNTHTHTNNSHAHTGSHSHTVPSVGHTSVYANSGGGSFFASAPPQAVVTTHTASSNSANTTYSSSTTSADSSSNEPEYVTVAFVEYQGDTSGASFLLSYLNMGGV